MDGAQEKPAVCVTTLDTSVLDVVKKLAAAHLHRLFVVDDKRKPIGACDVHMCRKRF